jgi:imidazolonepropionase-like amidohydrolase
MRLAAIVLAVFIAGLGSPQKARVVIAARVLLDGKGHILRDTRIVVVGSRIVRIDPRAAPVDYDLRGLTVLPGWIDAHVHLTWSFGEDGKNGGAGRTTQEAAYQSASNAWMTLMAGFTTVQNAGSPTTVALRDAIAQGALPGPRILTAIQPLSGQGDRTGTPEEIRAYVREQKKAGADVIKIFASGAIPRATDPWEGGLTLSQDQLNAACDEARKQRLRTMVHAYRDAVRAATVAGCTEVEHGLGATDDDLKAMAEHGTYFDPQAGLLIETYLLNRDRYAGTPFYPKTAAEFAGMEAILPRNYELVRRAIKTPGLKVIFGTDAVAGAHGRNAEEFIHRVVHAGVDPMAAMTSANSLAAEALGLANQIGAIAVGLQADIIGLDGDPLRDITAVRRVVFVMKGGIVYKKVAR